VNYPLWDLFVTMFYLFLWIVLIFLIFWVAVSIFRSQDLSGWGKAAWLVFIIVLPFIGVFAYLIVRGSHMAREQVDSPDTPQNEPYRAYGRHESRGNADELSKLADLRDRGVITDEEFQRGKTQLLS